jgi:hypothetical protein
MKRKLPVTDSQLHVMLHALGIQRRNGKWSKGGWRNYYSTHRDADCFLDCEALASSGWTRGYVGTSSDGEAWTFKVTAAGIAALQLAGWAVESGNSSS